MTLSVLRPNADQKKVGVLYSGGSVAWSLLDDGGAVTDYTGADDTSYIRAAAGTQYPNAYAYLSLTDLGALASDQRIKQLRIRARLRMHTAVAGDAAIVHAKLTDPQSGLGIMPVGTDVESTGIDKFEVGSATVVGRTGAWHPKPPPQDLDEWSRSMVNRLRLDLAWYYGNFGAENLRVTEAYVDVDVRTQPSVSTVVATGQDATTRPTITWAYNPNADGDPQIAFQVKVFTAAQYSAAGFDPDDSLATWNSGTRFGDAEQAQVGVDLANGGTYKTYVRAAQDFNGSRWWSNWAASSAFTVGLDPPPAPTLSITSDPTVPNLRNVLQFTATLNALAYEDADLEGSGAGNWVNGSGFSAVARSVAQARHGTGSLALTANGTATPFAANTGNSGAGAVATRPGAQHTLAGYARANTTTRAWRLVLRWHDAANVYLSQTNGSTVTDSNSAWTALPSVTGTAPDNAVFVYAQVETTATPANGEIHYVDQLQLVPGASAPAWAPGFLATSYAVIEAAVASTKPRNQAGRQLYGGGDDTRDASGFFTTGASSAVVFDMLDRVRGIGSIRWEIEDVASKLYFGWPSGTLDDSAPRYALAAVPGRVYTFSVYLRGTAPFSSQLNLQAINATGSTVGAATNGGPITIGTGWVRYTATITAPTGAVYIRPHLDNSAGVTGRRVWADAVQWELGPAPTDLTRPGGQALAWEPVRGFTVGKTAVPAGTQSLVAFDHEVPPGFTVIYRAWIFAFDPISGQPLSSPLTTYVSTLIDPPGVGQWVLSEVGGAPFLRGRVNVLPGLSYSQAEDVTVYHPLRPAPAGQVGQRPVALSDWIGGHDGTLQLAALSDDDFWLLERLMAVQDPLWLTESQGGGKYIRLTDRAWTRTRFRDKCVNLADGTRLEADEWEQVLTLGYVHADRPPDNEAAVLFDVESISGAGGGGGDLVFPGAPTNFIDSATCCNSSSVITVGGVTQDFGGNAGCNTAGTAPYDPAEPVSQWGIAGTHQRVEWKVRVDDDEPTHGHAWLLQASFAGAGGQLWEAGLHRNSTLLGAATKLVTFEVPGAVAAVAGTAVGAAAQSFTGGRRVVAPYAWTLGQATTLRVQADTLRGVDWWRLDVVDDLSLAVTYAGSVQVPAAWGDIDGAAIRATTEWLTPAAGGGSFATRPSSVFGGGFQNTGCFAPVGVGHQWLAISGGDVGGFAVSVDGVSWRPANANLLHRNKQRVSCVEGSRTVANRIWGYTSSPTGTGANAGFVVRGLFNAASGLIDWTTVATLTSAAQAGNVGDDHPRQVGRTMVLDEANDTAVLGTVNGLAVVTLSTGVVSYRALAGLQVTGVVVDPTNTQLCYCTVDDDQGTGGGTAITQVGTFGVGGSDANVASWACALPAGVQAGDVIVVDTVTNVSGAPAVTSTGYQAKLTIVAGFAGFTRLWKVAGSSEPNPTIVPAVSSSGRSIATVYRNVDQTTPWDCPDATNTTGTNLTTLALPSIQPVLAGALPIVGFADRVASGTINTHTPGANYTELGETSSSGPTSGSNVTLSGSSRTGGGVNPGTYGGDIWTASPTAGRLLIIHSALRPADPAGSGGVYRVANIRSGTVSTQRYNGLGNPQDIQIATVAGTRYCWVAAMSQGIRRWQISSDITTGWTDLTGTLVTTQGAAGVDVFPGAALSSTRVLVSFAQTGPISVDGGAWSTNGGATWSRESTAPWTVNPNPVGMSEPWWLAAAQASALLNGNTYESETPRINPATPDMAHLHGRSGVWQTLDGAINWRPTVDGQCVSGAIACAWDPTNQARIVLGDNDWDLFRSDDRLNDMPDQEDPSGANGPSTFDISFRPSGKLAVGIGDAGSNTLGEVYTTVDPWATTVTWTGQGFGAAGGGGRCKAVAIGQDAAATEVILAVVEGSGIYRKVGAAAPTLVSSLATGTQTSFPKFWWPTGGTTAAVYLAAGNGLFRSLDYGATWASIWVFTQTTDFTGQLSGDPTTITTLYLTVDDGTTAAGLYKVTSAATTPTTTKIGPTLDPPGQATVDPATGRVYVTATMDTPGGPKLYRSPAANPGPSDVFEDLTDAQWAAGVMQPRMLAVAGDGTAVAANAIGGYFVAETVGAGLSSCLQIPRVTGFFGTPGFASTLGSTTSGDPSAVAQPLLLGLHRPQPAP